MATVETVPIVEEELRVGTRQVETGRVRVETRTRSVEELAEAELETSGVEVTRVPVNRQVDRAPDIRTEGDVTIVPVLEEVLVVEKRLVLKEELHIRRSTKTERFAVPVALRKQSAVVTREENHNPPTRSEPMADTSDTTYSNRTITAFFDTRDDAQSAIDRLKGLGLSDGSVKLVRGDDEGVTDRDDSKGFWESLSDFFFPDDDRAAYAEGLRRGGFLVTATGIPSDKYSEALDILDDEGSVDVDARSAEWRNEGWAGSAGMAGGATAATGYAMGGTGVAAGDYGTGGSASRTAGETDLTGTGAVGGYGGASSTDASYGERTERDAGSSWAASAENTAREASDTVSDWAATAKDKVSSAAETASDKMGEWTSSSDDRASAYGSSDADRDRNALAGEAVTSSAAPVASDAARMDSTYDSLSGRSASAGDEEVIPVVQERLRVGKRDTDLGRVRVRSYTVEEPVSEDVNLHSERVSLERRPVDRALADGDAAFTDRTIEATEHREEPVVSKDARVTEEIGLRREGEDRTETVSDSVRRTEVEIEDERSEGRRDGTTGTRLSDTDR